MLRPLATALLCVFASQVFAALPVGAAAPDFTENTLAAVAHGRNP
jgi:hypothetical protein